MTNNNQTNGKKAHFENKFYKVGRIRYNSWASKILKACDIVVYDSELVHIYNSHSRELSQLGISALDFVKLIAGNFNEIYEGKENRKILIVRNPAISHYAVIELEFDGNRYKIKTALSVDTKRLSKWKLLLANIAH